MKYARLIAILGLLPVTAWSQVNIDSLFTSLQIDSIIIKVDSVRKSCQWTSITNNGTTSGTTSEVSNYRHTIIVDSLLYRGSDTLLYAARDGRYGNLYIYLDPPLYTTARMRFFAAHYDIWSSSSTSIESYPFSIAVDAGVYYLIGSKFVVGNGSSSKQSGGSYSSGCSFEFSLSSQDTNFISINASRGARLNVAKSINPIRSVLYPNPVTSHLTIEVFSNVQVEVFDQLGRVQSAPTILTYPHLQLDVSSLPSGCYWVRLGNEIYKFLKQ